MASHKALRRHTKAENRANSTPLDRDATGALCDRCGTPLEIDMSKRAGRCDDCRKDDQDAEQESATTP